MVFEAEQAVHLVYQLHHALDFVLYLFGRHEDVRVILREAAHAHQPVQRAGELVPVYKAQFAHAQGQVPVRAGLCLVHQHAARAVHGLDGKVRVVDDRSVHVLFVVVPVAAALPQGSVEHDGSADLLIACSAVDLAPVVDELVFQNHALGQEERKAGALLHQGEQLQLFAKAAVVALLRLLQHFQIFLKLACLGEGDAVQTVQAVALGVAAPIGGGHLQKLHGLQRAGAHQVRAGAQVGEIALRIHAELPALFGIFLQQLQLIILPGEQRAPLLCCDEAFFHRKIRLDNLLHLGLNGIEIARGKRTVCLDVVIPSVFQRRADAEPRLREQMLHGLRHHMCGRVPEGMLTLGRVEGHDLQRAVLFQRRAQIARLAVHLGGTGRLIQPRADAFRHLGGSDARLELPFISL